MPCIWPVIPMPAQGDETFKRVLTKERTEAAMASGAWSFSHACLPGRCALLSLVIDSSILPVLVSMATPHREVVPISMPMKRMGYFLWKDGFFPIVFSCL